MMTKDEIRDKGIKRLKRMNSPIYIFKKDDYTGYRCLYVEKSVAKYAHISNPFTIRYGPSPYANLKGLHPIYYKSSVSHLPDTEEKKVYDLLYELLKTGKLDLPILDPESLEYNE